MGTASLRESAAYDRAVLDFLDAFADHDEQWAGHLHRQVAARLVSLARPREGDACIDVGGGDGVVATRLSELVGHAGSVVVLDLGERSTADSRSRAAPNTHVMRMSGDDVFFRDGSFDIVVLSRSIAYASDPYAVLGEAIRLLSPGGRLSLFCRRRGLATRAEQLFLDELAAFVRHLPVNVPDQFHEYPAMADRRELELALRMGGLRAIEFGDVVSGGRAAGAAPFNDEMIACWPAARILVGPMAGRTRRQFDERIEAVMQTLGDDGFRYHHPYLVASGVKP